MADNVKVSDAPARLILGHEKEAPALLLVTPEHVAPSLEREDDTALVGTRCEPDGDVHDRLGRQPFDRRRARVFDSDH